MIGNVNEWTLSVYEGDGNYVLRGGSFISYRKSARSSYRGFNDQRTRAVGLGFRLASDIP
jgi:formylglycine-generating enzyme required for sulfatase activity